MGYAQWAAFAETTVAHRNLVWPVPENWTCEQGAACPVNFSTAYFAYWKAGLLVRSNERPAGSRVLIHAVAGGVGTAAVQIGKILGIEMYGTSSSNEKLARVQSLGLEHGINYQESDYEEVIKELSRGEGVDAVFEMLGGEHTAKSLRCLRDFGRVIQYGTATWKQPQLDVRALYAKSRMVQGLWLTYLAGKRDIMEAAWHQLSTWIEEGKLIPVVGHVLSLDRAAEAYGLLMERKNFGKVVLKISG